MSNIDENLKQRISSLSDNELLKMAYVESTDYRSEAINIAREEVKRRGLDENSHVAEVDNNNIDENSIRDLPHGIGWKIYFFIFILFQFLSLILNPRQIIVWMIHIIVTTNVLYSWIWARRIKWLIYIRWLIKLWSITSPIAAVAPFVVMSIEAFSNGIAASLDLVITLIITIMIYLPAWYAMYRLAWKSRLLYKTVQTLL